MRALSLLLAMYLAPALLLAACDGAAISAPPPPVEEANAFGNQSAPSLIEGTSSVSGVLLPLPQAPAPRSVRAVPAPEVSALAAIVVDAASGAALYGKNERQPLPPASLTKIATAVLAIEDGDLDSWAESNVDSTKMRGSTVMGLLQGDRFTLRDLLYGLMLPSGNDAALVIGRHLAEGSDAAFVARMNALMRRIGLSDSNFVNGHGLGGGPEHVSSAHDLAMLTRYAMTLDEFREVVGARRWRAEGSRVIEMGNVNTFLSSYPGADGVKTGYTRGAGQTFVASAVRGGHRLIVVALNAPNRNEDARALMDWAFDSFCWPDTEGEPC